MYLSSLLHIFYHLPLLFISQKAKKVIIPIGQYNYLFILRNQRFFYSIVFSVKLKILYFCSTLYYFCTFFSSIYSCNWVCISSGNSSSIDLLNSSSSSGNSQFIICSCFIVNLYGLQLSFSTNLSPS